MSTADVLSAQREEIKYVKYPTFQLIQVHIACEITKHHLNLVGVF